MSHHKKNQISKLELILDRYQDVEFLKAEGLDEAIIGVEEHSYRLIYSVKKSIDILAKTMKATKSDLQPHEIKEGVTVKDKSREMAIEYFYFNTEGAYVGKNTPIWCHDDF